MNNAQRIEHYLSNYADVTLLATAAAIERECDRHYQRALCVPLFDESIDFVHRLLNHPEIVNTLLVLVVNAPDSASTDQLKRTRILLRQIFSLKHNGITAAKPSGFDHQPNSPIPKLSKVRARAKSGSADLLVLDCCSQGHTLPPSEGVGLARKLGNDVALYFYQQARLYSPWLYQTDADALLPDNYFDMPSVGKSTAAIHLDFEHVNPSGTSTAQQLYDLKLDYYLAGLSYANSPYAHYSLGSAMIIHANYYAIVRGYPRRSAGEDFYLLNKLAKEGSIAFDKTRRIQLHERASTRVPFGTGPGVSKFNEYTNPVKAPAFYSPQCYIGLRKWLKFIDTLVVTFAGNSQICTRHALLNSELASPVLVAALDQLDLFSWLERTLKRNADSKQASHQLRLGMDALKTLQLIHALRDHGYTNVHAEVATAWIDKHPALQLRSGHQRNGVFTRN